jgi:pyridoxal phosphate enzyme (YggS family)
MEQDGIAERWRHVRERVAAACARSGRDPAGVGVVAVAKTFGPEAVREAAGAGIRVIGENRVQEARAKIPECPGGLEWHFIGHLQRNKAVQAVPLFQMIHAVDSIRLLETLDAVCAEAGRCMPVCLEINVSGESSKFGMAPADGPAALRRCESLMHVDVRGLMTIPPFNPDREAARPYFRALRELRDRWRDETGFALADLSMGMSDDYEVAVEEGATWVRIGTFLFGGRGGSPAGR